MKKILLSLALIILTTSCSMMVPKPHVVYERPDLDSKISKVIIFPTTDFNGKVSESAKNINLSIISGWGGVYGADKTIPAGVLIEKVASGLGKDSYTKFIKTLDNVSGIEQLVSNPNFKKLVTDVTDKLGNYQFALAIISGGEAEYNAGQPIYLHLGLFDTKNLTWRLITKIETKKTAVGNWKIASQVMVANSFEVFKKTNNKSE